MFELTGIIQKKSPIQNGESKNGTWQKMQLVVEVIGNNDKYPKKIAFQAWNDKVDLVVAIEIGSNVKIGFDIKSNEWKDKWYTNAEVIYIKNEDKSIKTKKDFPLPSDDDIISNEREEDDLPF